MQNYNFKTYAQLYKHIIKNHTNPTFLNHIENEQYKSIDVQEFGQKVEYLAFALKNMGIQNNHNVAIYMSSSPNWLIVDFALQLIGAISVPIFANISSKNLEYQINDSCIKYMFCDHNQLSKNLEKKLTLFYTQNRSTNGNVTLNDLYKMGKDLSEKKIFNMDELVEQIDEKHIFSIIYTSGSTGVPKGVELSHKNIISQLHCISVDYHLSNKDRALSLLPLAHIFERAVMSYYLSQGVSVYFVDDLLNIARLMKEVKPTMMTVVPRLLEKIFNKIKTRISEKKGLAKFIAKAAFNRALTKEDKSFNLLDKVYEKIVYSKFKESFGGELEILVTGGASLNKQIYQFFVNIGLNLYQGYGLTEFSPVICANSPTNSKVGTSGLPFKGVEVKLGSENELLARGDSLMKGYKNQPELTKETIDEEGWLHTGDLASIDKEGFITIHSRKKELFKTSTGEYVSIIPIEQELSKSRFIDFAAVIANDRQYVSALLFVDIDTYKQYKEKNHLDDFFSLEDFYNLAPVQKKIKKHINNINKDLNKWEHIIKYKIITHTLTIEDGELTPSMKICRAVIEDKYKEQITSMY